MTAVPVTPPATVRDALRPFVLLAVVAFVLGFLGYVTLSGPVAAPSDTVAAAPLADPATAGPPSDDWNLPKHI
jgi:hypothetical protein